MDKITSKVEYTGHLMTSATHVNSGEKIITDAPVDNNGKGAYFSPTDLLATSLASCMLTLMGIHAEKNKIKLGKIDVEVTKIMASTPRRVGGIRIHMKIEDNGYTESERGILETAALTCPVAKSLHPDIEQDIAFTYQKREDYV